MGKELWKAIVETDRYFAVSSYGRVKRLKSGGSGNATLIGGLCCPRIVGSGYIQVKLCFKGRTLCRYTAVLVARAFLGPRPLDKEVNHKDGDKTNNHVSNLEYITHAANVRHAVRTGLLKPLNSYVHIAGENNYNTPLTWSDVHKIRKFYRPGFGEGALRKELGLRFGVTPATIYNIVTRRTWK